MQYITAKLESTIVDLNRKHEIDLAEITNEIKTGLSKLQQMAILNLTTNAAASNITIKIKSQEENIVNLTATANLSSPGKLYRKKIGKNTLRLHEL